LVFDDPVFVNMTVVSPRSDRLLNQIAAKLRPLMAEYTLVVEGHTDSVPMSSQSKYKSNYALGMARADAARSVLVVKYKLSGGSVTVASAGGKDSPYPNDTAVNRRKNRTVVLELIRN
jgi:chemotaxis protein MotB